MSCNTIVATMVFYRTKATASDKGENNGRPSAIWPPISLFVRHIPDQTSLNGNACLTLSNVIVANTKQIFCC